MVRRCIVASILWLQASCAFQSSHAVHRNRKSKNALEMTSDAADKARQNFSDKAVTAYDDLIQSIFPGAISNKDLEVRVCDALAEKGYTPTNTLLATSLCCDELARELEYDFVRVYGKTFNLGGLAGFPFAGKTGFVTMATHIPDDGSVLIIHGPHVGVAHDGEVGRVERKGIPFKETCCASAIVASGYLKTIVDGGAPITPKIQEFTDFQQGAVQELILPHGKPLKDAGDMRMTALPYALYESQDLLVRDIIASGAENVKNNIALLGGIQINTAPDAMDYFLPLRFDYMDNTATVLEDMLPMLAG